MPTNSVSESGEVAAESPLNGDGGSLHGEKESIEEAVRLPEVTMAHPKAREWIVGMAKADYQELAKLAKDSPELVKLQDPATGYTALHWAAKHGNEDVVKLIAGSYKGDVNARSNGGYTPLHMAMQFGRVNIFELLCNVYKANRDLMDWSGNKPLDYSQQRTSVSASTYSSEYNEMFLFNMIREPNQDDAFWWNFGAGGGTLGGGSTLGTSLHRKKKRSTLRFGTVGPESAGGNSVARTQSMAVPSSRKSRSKKPPLSSVLFAEPNQSPFLTVTPSTPTSAESETVLQIIEPNNNTEEKKEQEVPTLAKSKGVKGKRGEPLKEPPLAPLASTRRKKSFMRRSLNAIVAKTAVPPPTAPTKEPTKRDSATNLANLTE